MYGRGLPSPCRLALALPLCLTLLAYPVTVALLPFPGPPIPVTPCHITMVH